MLFSHRHTCSAFPERSLKDTEVRQWVTLGQGKPSGSVVELSSMRIPRLQMKVMCLLLTFTKVSHETLEEFSLSFREPALSVVKKYRIKRQSTFSLYRINILLPFQKTLLVYHYLYFKEILVSPNFSVVSEFINRSKDNNNFYCYVLENCVWSTEFLEDGRESNVSLRFHTCRAFRTLPFIWLLPHQGEQPNGDGWEWSNSDVMNYFNWERNPFTALDRGFCGSLSRASGKKETATLPRGVPIFSHSWIPLS